jgi:hypothetical protein
VFNSDAEIAAQKPQTVAVQHVSVVERPATGDKATDARPGGRFAWLRDPGIHLHTPGEQLRLLGTASPRLIELVADHKAGGGRAGGGGQLWRCVTSVLRCRRSSGSSKARPTHRRFRDQALGALWVELGDRRASMRPLLDR